EQDVRLGREVAGEGRVDALVEREAPGAGDAEPVRERDEPVDRLERGAFEVHLAGGAEADVRDADLPADAVRPAQDAEDAALVVELGRVRAAEEAVHAEPLAGDEDALVGEPGALPEPQVADDAVLLRRL